MEKKKTTKTTTVKKTLENKSATKKKTSTLEPVIEKEIESTSDFTKNSNLKKENEKSRIRVKPIIKLLLLLIVIIVAFIFAKKFFCKKTSYKDKATYTTAFFIKNSKGKYALYNESGKKLTDFKYDSVSTFINNTALVYNEKDGYSVINSKGKDVVSNGDYNYITAYAGLYKVRSDKGYKLIDNKGKTVIDAKDINISSYGDDYPFSVVSADNTIKVLSYDAKTIVSFKKKEDVKSPTINHIGEYSTIFYNGKTVVFNSRTKKVISEFSEKSHYCINNVSDDGRIITLNACTTWYEKLDEKGNGVITKGKFTNLSSKCDELTLYDDVVTCSKNDGEYFVNISGKKVSIGDKINSRSAFIDGENYVTRNNKNYKLDFYKNGKKVKSIDASLSATGKMNKDIYVLYVDNGYEYYNKEGKKVIKQSFKNASSFDKNGLARVSDDGSTYYLINTKGKKISDKYNTITYYENYYQVTNAKALKGIINKKGKEILNPKYISITIKNIRDTYYAVATDKNNKNYVYNLDKNKLIKETKDALLLTDHYIKTSGNKTGYYTYKDKLIYEEK